ncbi:hypothetical protein NLU13_8523 [Sarocladium strictum]|uniref:Uncharacterized protein n=1 Tax=Sarocladium strictum TaxID=5046 RepID=A0AA39L534_SARSR|nr:hypothetical protein NLU13_8523 [Sarocladium strictum]
MPKRATESRVSKPDNSAPKAQKKSERSHEENQERAYIAASRRADRSIEARVQSARMASEIHKKRTGKSFRITEDIVIKEEMYEEEDDDFPRSYRLLGPHMQTGSAEMNSRLEAFLTNKIAMSQYVARGGERWEKENEINKLFAASFPNLDAQAKALSQSFSNPNYNSGATQPQNQTSGSLNTHVNNPQSPLSPLSPTFQHPQAPITYQRTDSATSDMSPPALSPGSPTSRATPSFSVPGPMDFGGSSSAFTADLPNEARMMFAGMAPTGQDPYGQASMFDPALTMDWMTGTPQPQYFDPKLERNDASIFDAANAMQSPTLQWDPTLSGNAQSNDDDWNDFINDQAWGETQIQ